MDNTKKEKIEQIIDDMVKSFANSLEDRHIKEIANPNGAINRKKNNAFIAELNDDFMIYSALCRSFDSSMGSFFEKLGNKIAALSYEVRGDIVSYILPEQETRINEIYNSISSASNEKEKPSISQYNSFVPIKKGRNNLPNHTHKTDHYFVKTATEEYFLLELKAGGDLDSKKAPAEKKELLTEYFLLKNKLIEENTVPNIKIYLATAYNMYGEGNEWKQGSVKSSFSDDELLIGKDYWNFICDDPDGFDVVFSQYKKSAKYIDNALEKIKDAYTK